MIWEIIVAGIGMAVLYRMSTKKTTTALAILYALITLVVIGIKSIL